MLTPVDLLGPARVRRSGVETEMTIDDRAGSQEALAKGVNFRSFVESLGRLRGKRAVEATLDAAPKDVREAIQFGQIIAAGWYPVSWYRELYLAAQRALGEGIELPRMVGRDAATHDFNSLFRLILRALSPETAFGQAHRLVTLFYQGGSAKRLGVRTGVGQVRFSGWVGFDRNLWEDTGAGAEAIITLCGARNVRKYVLAGGHDGCDHLDLRWQ
jgi:hypothetical protein